MTTKEIQEKIKFFFIETEDNGTVEGFEKMVEVEATTIELTKVQVILNLTAKRAGTIYEFENTDRDVDINWMYK